MTTLSKTDRKILGLLQRVGRMSVAELGRQVGLTPTSCPDRIKRLETQGIITGYHPRPAHPKLKTGLLAFV